MNENAEMILSSSNRITWAYFEILRSLAAEANQLEDADQIKSKAAVAIQMAVCVVEAYLNVAARLAISQTKDENRAVELEACFRSNRELSKKLKRWPELFFGKKAELGRGVGAELMSLVRHRNRLMHYSSEAYSHTLDFVTLNGLIDTSCYDSLTSFSASNALDVAERFLCYLFELQGVETERIPHVLHRWSGKPVPVNAT